MYAHAPRLLDCLHKACEACLHDWRERGRAGGVSCAVCGERTSVTTTDIGKLSYDWPTIGRVRRLGLAMGESGCDECCDDVPSDSWCESCGVALSAEIGLIF